MRFLWAFRFNPGCRGEQRICECKIATSPLRGGNSGPGHEIAMRQFHEPRVRFLHKNSAVKFEKFVKNLLANSSVRVYSGVNTTKKNKYVVKKTR
jgi:hypothetical protein